MSLFTFKAICYYDSYLHKGIAIGLPWGCGGIVNGSPWACWVIGGSPWDCLWIAFGFLDWTGLPLDCLWVCLGIGGRWGLPRGCLRFANGILFGIMQGLPWDCRNFARVWPRDWQGIALSVDRASTGTALTQNWDLKAVRDTTRIWILKPSETPPDLGCKNRPRHHQNFGP